ncbi:hypothetical protein CPT_Moonbeam68 [Bacillus phage Moonbeam]|uniref:Uncharacterized protein n=1 Tax=Bacillus phage Moonbeam TaxID=1540091 RepID=A0A0A0RSI3_9CAUD|nr:hypothetical protein CPT_Moonbeam68 [Bacillus phage Moonbeam]AIW03466.1 hypothetical protein CPT_Moonbeam68 [Bacillus phage Moonbeam]
MTNYFRDKMYEDVNNPAEKIDAIGDRVDKERKKLHAVYVVDYDNLKVQVSQGYDWYPSIQKAFDVAKLQGAKAVVFPDEPNMYVSSTPTYYSTNAKPMFIGQGHGVTVLKGLNTATLLKISGGSGSFSGLSVENIGFQATAGSVNLEIAGTCNGLIRNCRFYSGKNAIVLHNANSGEFTEYIVAEDCVFDSGCQQVLQYKKTNGNESFHGSGLVRAKINQSDTETLPKIQIDAGCFPYNSPLDMQVWTRCATSLVKNNNTTKFASFYGTITLECFGSAYTGAIVDASTTKGIYFAGHVLALGNQFQYGKRLILVDRVQYNSDGSVTAWRKPYSLEGTITTGDNTVDVSLDSNISLELNVLVYGNNYEYSYLIKMYKNRTDNNGMLRVAETQREFNGAGYGPPVFTYSNGSLVISNTNFPATGLTYVVTASPLGGRSPYRLT